MEEALQQTILPPLLHNSPQRTPNPAEMDSFSIVDFPFPSNPASTGQQDVPVEREHGDGSGPAAYCVVA